MYKIIGVSVQDRREHSLQVQTVLSNNGCSIKARLGLPQQSDNVCTNEGLLILQVEIDEDGISKVINELNSIDGVKASSMTI